MASVVEVVEAPQKIIIEAKASAVAVIAAMPMEEEAMPGAHANVGYDNRMVMENRHPMLRI